MNIKQGKLDAVESALRIPGWTSREELTWLYEVAADIVPPGSLIAEIGSWFGRSAWVLASAMEGGELHLVDPCMPVAVPGSLPSYDYLMQARHLEGLTACLQTEDSMPDTVLHRETSAAAAAQLAERRFGMVWIDADHSYEACLADIYAWTPLLQQGGIICGHDYGDVYTEGVTRAVNQSFGEAHLTRCGSIWAIAPSAHQAQ